MIEEVKSLDNQIKSSSFAEWKVFEDAKIKVNEARCMQSISRKTGRARR